MPPTPSEHQVSFGPFLVDLRSGELQKHGIRIRLQDQPFQVLALLIARPGEVVLRDELRKKLWPVDTFVDFDVGLNTAVKRLRDALGDTVEHPKYIETLPRKGYRFIAAVNGHDSSRPVSEPDRVAGQVAPGLPQGDVTGFSASGTEPSPKAVGPRTVKIAAAGAVLAAALALLVGFNTWGLRDRLFRKPSQRVQSVAVLPLANLTGDAAQEYFVDGMTDALVNELGRFQGLRVISRQSVMQFKGSHLTAQEIARKLNVEALVEGSVTRAGNRVHINAELIQVAPEQHLMSGAYERDATDILFLQADVARAIGREIRIKLTPQQEAELAGVRPINTEAHDLCLKGFYYWYQGTPATPENYEKSREYFQKAIDADPTYPLGYDGLAWYYAIVADIGLLPPQEGWTRARAAAQKSTELSGLPSYHITGPAELFYDWNWRGAEEDMKKAIENRPNDSQQYRNYSNYLRTMHRMDESIAMIRKAQELDPLTPAVQVSVGWTYYYARRFEDAAAEFKKTFLLDKNSVDAHYGIAKCYEHVGLQADAVTEWETVLKLYDAPDLANSFRQTYKTAGYQSAMRGLWRIQLQSMAEEAKHKYVPAVNLANLYALLGDKDHAFAWLAEAFQQRNSKLIDLDIDADFDALRSDPRFADLLRRIGLPQAPAEAARN